MNEELNCTLDIYSTDNNASILIDFGNSQTELVNTALEGFKLFLILYLRKMPKSNQNKFNKKRNPIIGRPNAKSRCSEFKKRQKSVQSSRWK